jgi:hypothetical protein
MPLDLRLGIKVYDSSWSSEYGLSARELTRFLQEIGCTFVIAQSKLLPMHSSAVRNDHVPDVDDIALREMVGEAGIGYVACLNIGFDPALALAEPDRLPVDQNGRRETLQDWYIGLPPTRSDNTAHKANLLDQAVPALKPDGVHLGFVRWPGFWETWLPDIERVSKPEYSFDRDTVAAFAAQSGNSFASLSGVDAARILMGELRVEWTEWKCRKVVEQIGKLREVVHRRSPSIPIAVNTLPFDLAEFNGAIRDVFGQSIEDMRSVVDVFEVMAYHQILRRGSQWPSRIVSHIASRAVPSQAICTLQVSPLYLDGMHANQGRAATIDSAEFAACIDAVSTSAAAGLCVFTLADLLMMKRTAEGRSKLAALASFRR